MTRASFDALIARLAESRSTLSERDLLESSHWSLGEDARLREDPRFRETRWGRWMLAEDLVANDAIHHRLYAEQRGSAVLDAELKRAAELFGRRCVFCVGDPRFVLRRDEVCLAATELSHRPVVEDTIGDLEKYRTHLPLHTLKAAAASAPAGEWGERAQDQMIETLGWVRVSLPGRRLNDRMFIAAIEGHSMDDGKSGLVDGGYAVFELWPSGTKQNLSVLVRGAFLDPETGSYAVKKYVADQRDESGRHNKISLVSLNANKDRYPDIELKPEDDDAVTVVAKVVQALSPEDYERRPKPQRRVGRRNFTGDEQQTRLVRRLASFFDDTPSEGDDEATNPLPTTGWRTRLVCLDVAAGGLQLEVGPLDGLPSFVKKLRVVGKDWDAVILAANARVRPTRTPVRPSTGPWRWEAVGFEGEADIGVYQLALDALGVEGPVVFRIDSDGIGQEMKTTKLALGQAYRLLLPPDLGTDIGTELDGGWRIWSFDLTTPPSATTRQRLTAIGLEVGEAWPRLDWALNAPSVWRINARGESYAVFETGIDLRVNVGGVSTDDGDEAFLFLHGPSGTERLQVLANGIISLGAPLIGRWACALLHSRTSVPSSTLFFEVAENASESVAATCTAVAHNGPASLEGTAPPGWPVSLRWRGVGSHEEILATLCAGEDGTVPFDSVASVIEARAARTRIADLVVDFGEIGWREIAHDGRASLKQVRERLTSLWRQRANLVKNQKGAWIQLRKQWFEPITELFGYGLDDAPLRSAERDGEYGLAAWRLTVDERTSGGIERSASRVLVLTTDVEAVLRDHRPWIDGVCSSAKVREAIITDGSNWTTHRKGSQQITQQVWNLEQAIDHGNLDQMLGDLAEGL